MREKNIIVYSAENASNIHKDHRKRVREHFLKGGLESCPEHQVLEFFLFPFVPQKDTNVIAHELINRFGSLSMVFDADYEELLTVKNMTVTAAAHIALFHGIEARINFDKAKKADYLITVGAANDYIKSLTDHLTVEQAYILCLNNRFKVIRCVPLQKGIVDQTAIYLRQIAEIAINSGATNVILIHNHPSGDVNPSDADNVITKDIVCVLPSLGVNLLDHIIVGRGDHYSFRENDKLEEPRNELNSRYSNELNDAFNIWNTKELISRHDARYKK
ncbi:MAG: hypothetical protein LBT20_07185 [Clostridiales bacterium]|jgi:DNA repair protein RadC|nr:hypothetical protein [Clostridiales bacterium]